MASLARSRRRTRRDEHGAAAVEFALIVPILLLLVLGMIQYSFYFWAKQGGSDMARGAARMSAVGNPASCGDFQGVVTTQLGDFAAVQDLPSAAVTRSYTKGPGNTGTEIEVGDLVTVTVSFKSINMNIPLIPFVADGRVSETAEARVEYVPSQPEACA